MGLPHGADVISQITGVPSRGIVPATSFADKLQISAIGMSAVAVAAEARSGVKIPKEDIKTLSTAGDLTDCVFDRQS